MKGHTEGGSAQEKAPTFIIQYKAQKDVSMSQMGPWTVHCVTFIHIKSRSDTKMEKYGTLSFTVSGLTKKSVHNQVNTVAVDKKRCFEATNAR